MYTSERTQIGRRIHQPTFGAFGALGKRSRQRMQYVSLTLESYSGSCLQLTLGHAKNCGEVSEPTIHVGYDLRVAHAQFAHLRQLSWWW